MKSNATRIRLTLMRSGAPTYELQDNSITCLCCGLTSHHPDDIAQRYCGACQAFHSERTAGNAFLMTIFANYFTLPDEQPERPRQEPTFRPVYR